LASIVISGTVLSFFSLVFVAFFLRFRTCLFLTFPAAAVIVYDGVTSYILWFFTGSTVGLVSSVESSRSIAFVGLGYVSRIACLLVVIVSPAFADFAWLPSVVIASSVLADSAWLPSVVIVSSVLADSAWLPPVVIASSVLVVFAWAMKFGLADSAWPLSFLGLVV
jgi:hypothetical protein